MREKIQCSVVVMVVRLVQPSVKDYGPCKYIKRMKRKGSIGISGEMSSSDEDTVPTSRRH